MKMGFRKSATVFLSSSVFLLPSLALAYDVSESNLNFLPSSLGLGGIISHIVTWILTIAGALATIYLIYSGIMYITSAGSSEKAQNAKNGVVYAIIGIVIIVLALAIIKWVPSIIQNGSST